MIDRPLLVKVEIWCTHVDIGLCIWGDNILLFDMFFQSSRSLVVGRKLLFVSKILIQSKGTGHSFIFSFLRPLSCAAD